MWAWLGVVFAMSAWGVLPASIAMKKSGPRIVRNAPAIRALLRLLAVGAFAASLALETIRPLAIVLTGFFVVLSVIGQPDILFKVLDRPNAVRAEDAGVGSRVEIVGVVSDGEARAYVLDAIARHHLINDVITPRTGASGAAIGQRPILASYCPLCMSAVVFDPRVDGRALTFAVAGFWRRNMLMRDRETGSIWQQTTGECVAGPLAGKALEPAAFEQSTWAAFRAEHTGAAIVMAPPRPLWDFRRWIPLEWTFPKFAGRINAMGPLSHGRVDPRLPAREVVAGVELAGEARAYPLSALRSLGHVEDTVGDRPMTIDYDAEADRVRAKTKDGVLPVRREMWVSWSEYHPGTTVWTTTIAT